MPLLIVYSTIVWCLYPVVVLWVWYRATKGKADIKRWREYIGYPSFNTLPSCKKLLWLHAASLGEIKAATPAIRKLEAEFPDMVILITTTTRSGEQAAREMISTQIIHQYMCVDCPQAIGRFLNFWQPDYVIFVESELWPCMLHYVTRLKKIGTKVILLNGRMSPSSFKRWEYCRSLLIRMLEVFDIIIAASKRDAEIFATLTIPEKIKYFGNIKYAMNHQEFGDSNAKDPLALNCNGRPVWLCASIHPGEDNIILQSHIELRNKLPGLLTIIVPRHVLYCKTIAKAMEMLKIEYALRSNIAGITGQTEICLVDTFGELRQLYKFADVAFVGGSLVNHGGQNVLEAAFLQVPIIVGPNYHNFADIVEEILERDGLTVVNNQQELSAATYSLFTNSAKKNQMIEGANQVMRFYQHVLDNTMNEILKILN